MKRLLCAIALTLPLFAVGLGAQPAGALVPSEFCTDNSPAVEEGVVLVNTGGVYLAVVVWPVTTQPLVGLCYRLPTGQAGAIVIDVINRSSVSLTNSVVDLEAHLQCWADPSPNALLCSYFLGGVELYFGAPTLSAPGTGICFIGGVCTPARIAVIGSNPSLTIYLPISGSPLFVPITIPSACIVDFTGNPC